MNLEEIKKAIMQLPPQDFLNLRKWFEESEKDIAAHDTKDVEQYRETLRRFRGSFKGKGLLKSLEEERRRECFL